MTTIRACVYVTCCLAAGCLAGCLPLGATTATVRSDPVDQRPAEFTPQHASSTTMQVWLAAWEDQRGDLHAPSTVYVEVDPTKWSYGEQSPSSRYSVLRPLQVETRVEPPPTPTGMGANSGIDPRTPAAMPPLPPGTGQRGV